MSFVADVTQRVGRSGLGLIALAMLGLSCVPEVIGAPPEVGSVAVSGAPERLYVGSDVVLSVAVTDTRGLSLARQPVTWATSNEGVARVDAQGKVRGVGAGAATITATAGGKGTPVPFTVIEPVASVGVSAAQPSVVAGEALQLTASPRDGAGVVLSGRSTTWVTSDTNVATVSPTGLLTAKAYVGPSTRSVGVTATSEGRSGSLSVSVTPVPVATVVVSTDSTALEPTVSQRLTASVRSATGVPLTGRTFTWSSTDTAVALVSDSGLVTARAYLGGATRMSRVVVSSEGKADTSLVVVVPLAVSTVSLQGAPSDSVLLLGTSLALAPTLRSSAGLVVTDRQVSWTSSAAAVASVSSSGVVTPVAAGLRLSRRLPRGRVQVPPCWCGPPCPCQRRTHCSR